MKKDFITQPEDEGLRLDIYLQKFFHTYSRSFLSKQIKEGFVLINKKIVKPSYEIKSGDCIEINFPEEKVATEAKPEQIPLDVIYEDENILVINKQAGLVVHPAAGNQEGTLVNALLHYLPEIGESVYLKESELSRSRPGLIHRLDKDTTGVMVIAKNAKALHSLSKQIKDRAVTKIYYALCFGWPKDPEGKLINYLGRHPKNRKMVAEVGAEKGREAISFYKVIEFLEDNKKNKISLIEFDIKTGRTHQIRVQSTLMGNPVIGDSIYGSKSSQKISASLKASRQMLHAKSIFITIPREKSQRKFEADFPKDFKKVLSELHKADY